MKKKKSVFGKIFVIICIAILIFCGYKTYMHFSELSKNDKDLKALATEDKNELKRLNSDMVGWIKIKNTKINYPVMQTKEIPQYYLHRNFKKQWTVSGCIFVDANSDLDRSSNFLIYGHHMLDNTMFGSIVKYDDQEYYKKHRYIHFNYWDEEGKFRKRVYEVISAYKASTDDNPCYLDYAEIDNPKQFNDYLSLIKERSEIKARKSAEWGDDLITLSTCSYHIQGHHGRFCVVGVCVKEE